MDAWALLASGHNSEAGGEAKKSTRVMSVDYKIPSGKLT